MTTKTAELRVDVRMRTGPIRSQMLALADMYEQAAAAMCAGVERLDALDQTEGDRP